MLTAPLIPRGWGIFYCVHLGRSQVYFLGVYEEPQEFYFIHSQSALSTVEL